VKAPLVIPPGIYSDDTTFASAGRWADGNNMRPWRGSMQTIGGWNLLTSGLTGVCRSVLPWTDNDGYQNIAFATHSKLYVRLNGTDYDITPAAGFTAGAEHGAGGPGYGAGTYGSGTYGVGAGSNYFPLTWSLANWGENLLAAPRNQTLFVWDNNTANDATSIANAPDNISYMLVSKRQVFALGCNEEVSTDFNPLCIRASDFEDYTNWTTTATNNAFEYIISGSGRIVAGAEIGDFVVVWTDNGLYLGQDVGSGTVNYRFDRIAENCGLIGPNAFTVINQTAYWITPDYQFYRWQPGMEPQLLPCPIRNDFKDNASPSQFEKIACTSIGQYGEVWWFYADSRDGIECSRYVAYSTTEDKWFRGQMARSACVDAGPTRFPIFVTSDGYAYWHEEGHTANGGALEWSLTTADQYVNEAGNFMMLRGIWPDFEDQKGGVSLTLTMRKYPQASTTYTKGPYSLSVGASKKDFMASCRVISAEFSGASSPAFVRFGKPVLDAVVTGQQ
jgi:hypothetical protein